MSQETAPEGGSGKVFLILGLLVGVGLGAGAGIYFSKGASDAVDGEHGSEETAQAAKPKEPLISIPFEHVAVPIYLTRDNKRRFIGNYFVNIEVQVRGEKNQISVKRSMSQLTHGFIAAISKADMMREDSPTELDMDKAAIILKAKASEVMGSGIVHSVAITEAIRMPR